MLPEIRNFLNSHSDATGTVHCVGHSLGGAVATLAADWVSANKINEVKLYTFGAPRPGLFFFANNLTRKLNNTGIRRVYHATDPVPMIPLFPFIHPPLPGYGHYIPSSEAILSADAHDMKKYLGSVGDLDWRDLQRRQPPFNSESAIEEWLNSKMRVSSATPKVWQWINAAMIYVLKKILGGFALSLNFAAMGVVTIADAIALLLRRGIELAQNIGSIVLLLMRKIMQALGMKIVEAAEDLTRSLLRFVLTLLMDRIAREAQKAIRNSTIL